MNFLHYDFQLSPNEVIEVTLDKRANVRLLDDINFSYYERGVQHKYQGGFATTSPVVMRPPHTGHWHVVIDLGGYPGTVRSSARVIKS